MSTAQKIIKYCAEAFALFLAVTIISSVVIAGYKILSTVGLITTENENIETKTLDKLCSALNCKIEDIAEFVEK